MDEQDTLARVAEKYRKDGYDVLLRPPASELPSFLEDTAVDVLARKGDEIVALQLKGPAASEGEAVHVAGDFEVEQAAVLLEEAESLLHPSLVRSALVMGWAAFEGAARAALQPGREAFAAIQPRLLIEQLRSNGLMSREEAARLEDCRLARNAIAHGFRPKEVPLGSVLFLLRITRGLLQKTAGDGGGEADGASMTTLSAGLAQTPELKTPIDRATKVLYGLLGPSQGSVSIEWDLAEGPRHQSVLVLTLSDLTGKVTATFAPPELEDTSHLRSRLNQLWGDLLQVRSHRQVQELLGQTGT